MGGVGQGGGESRRQAVGGHDVEADTGDERHAGGARLVAAPLDRLEDPDLARDVEIVGAGRQTGGDHRLAGVEERSGAVQHGGDSRDAFGQRCRIVEAEGAALEPEAAGDGLDRGGASPGEDGAQAPAHGLVGDQLAGVAVGAVDEQVGAGHSRAIVCADVYNPTGVRRRRR
jgi:hypothetical protein